MKKIWWRFLKNIFRKRTPLFLCTLFLCIFLPAILLCSHCFDRALFHKITSAYVQSSLEHDALSLHFVMAYPNLQGIHLKDAALPVYSKEASEASAASRQKFLSVLSFLDSKKLNEEERYTYDLLCDRLALDLEESDFSYYEEPLSPTSGMQSELLLLFAEYPFYTADDVETYLSLLQSVPDYVQGLLSYESEKSAAGLFMEKEDAKKVHSSAAKSSQKEALSPARTFYRRRFLPDLHLFYKRTSDRQAAVTIRSPKPVAFVKIRPARLAVPRRRAGTAFRHRAHEGRTFPEARRAAILCLARQGIHRLLPFHGSALFAPSKTVSENLQRDEADADHLSGADRRYA